MTASTFVHPSATLSGCVKLGVGSIVEPYALLGHPLQSDVEHGRRDGDFGSAWERSTSGSVTEVGKNATIRSHSVLYQGSLIGDYVEIGHHAVLREGVSIGDYTRVWAHASIRRDARIGPGCRVGGVVGDRCVLEPYVTTLGFLVHDFKSGVGGELESAPVLCSGSVVSRGAIVVGGVRVGKMAFIGAGSVVLRDVPETAVMMGNPARQIGTRPAEEIERVNQRIMEGKFL